MKKVLVLGGGFAGIQAAIDLQKTKQLEVTLVSDRDFMYIYPITIWIPVHRIDENKTKIPLEKISKKHGFNVIIDKVTSIKSANNQVVCSTQSLNYDYLVVAFGSDKLQLKGMESSTTICGKPEQTLELRTQLDELIAKGSGKIAVGFGVNPKDKSAVRGGPGFEFIFNIDYYLRKKGIRNNFELTMFSPAHKPGLSMGDKVPEAIQKMLASKGIKMHFGKKITEFNSEGILFADNSSISSDITMFVSAGTGSALLKNSDLPLSESGFVKINKYCEVIDTPDVYAIGDAAALEGPGWAAKQGHVAEVMASNVAYNILQKIQNTNKKKSYIEHLNIMCVLDIGNGAILVFRNNKKQIMIPMPIVGHWMKQAWGLYAKWTKLKLFPKIV